MRSACCDGVSERGASHAGVVRAYAPWAASSTGRARLAVMRVWKSERATRVVAIVKGAGSVRWWSWWWSCGKVQAAGRTGLGRTPER